MPRLSCKVLDEYRVDELISRILKNRAIVSARILSSGVRTRIKLIRTLNQSGIPLTVLIQHPESATDAAEAQHTRRDLTTIQHEAVPSVPLTLLYYRQRATLRAIVLRGRINADDHLFVGWYTYHDRYPLVRGSQNPTLYLPGTSPLWSELTSWVSEMLESFEKTAEAVPFLPDLTSLSCFISYARADAEFVDRLDSDLRATGIACWKDTKDMRGGGLYRPQIQKAIESHDKMILVCSERSFGREAVVEEIDAAIAREKEIGAQKLFPIRLDDFILSDKASRIAREKVAGGGWYSDWVKYVRAFHIPDFSGWRDPEQYRVEFERLVKTLRSPPSTAERATVL
jgi:hypothetical protein